MLGPVLVLLSNRPRATGSDLVFPSERGDSFHQGTKRVWPEAVKRGRRSDLARGRGPAA